MRVKLYETTSSKKYWPRRVFVRLVDPRHRRQCRWCGWLAHEAFGVGSVSGVQDEPALSPHELGPAVVDVGGCVEADPRMAVVGVVPAEETPAEGVGVLEAAEAARELWTVLEGAEL